MTESDVPHPHDPVADHRRAEQARAAIAGDRGADPSPPRPRTVQVTGTLMAGLRPGTLTVVDDATGARYLIRDPAAHDLADGSVVTLRGQVTPGIVTIEQQGDPLTVLAVLHRSHRLDSGE
jgi:hypothetical protein